MTEQITGKKPLELPESFQKFGYTLAQIHRSPYAAIYTVTDVKTGASHGFEVFAVKIQQERTTPSGIHFAFKEMYPSKEDFGVWAFAPRTRERAFQIFAELECKALREKPVEDCELAI